VSAANKTTEKREKIRRTSDRIRALIVTDIMDLYGMECERSVH